MLEKKMAIQEEYQSIGHRVKTTLDDFEEYDSRDIFHAMEEQMYQEEKKRKSRIYLQAGEEQEIVYKRIPIEKREKAFKAAVKRSRDRLKNLETNLLAVCAGRLGLLSEVDVWFEEKGDTMDKDEHEWNKWEVEAAMEKAGVISEETMMQQLEEIKNMVSHKQSNAARKILNLHTSMIQDMKFTVSRIIQHAKDDLQAVEEENEKYQSTVDDLILESREYQEEVKDLKSKSAELAKNLMKVQKSNVQNKSDRSKAIAAKNVAIDEARHLEKQNKAFRDEQGEMMQKIVAMEGNIKRAVARAEIAEEGLSSADSMLSNERNKLQALSAASNEEKRINDILREKLRTKETELIDGKKRYSDLMNALDMQNRAHEKIVEDITMQKEFETKEKTNQIFELFRYNQAIWHGSLLGQFLSFAAISTPTMGAVAAGEVNFEKLDTLTREQTADIVHQVETQFKNLKQTQRDLFDGTLPIPEKDRVETTGMNAEDLESLSKSKLRAAQLKQQNVSFKMRLAAEKELNGELRKRVGETTSVLEKERQEWRSNRHDYEGKLFAANHLATTNKQLIEEHEGTQKRLQATIDKLTEALQHGGDEESQLRLLLQRLKELEGALTRANSDRAKQEQELLRQRQEMNTLKRSLDEASTTKETSSAPMMKITKLSTRNKKVQKTDDELLRLRARVSMLTNEIAHLKVELNALYKEHDIEPTVRSLTPPRIHTPEVKLVEVIKVVEKIRIIDKTGKHDAVEKELLSQQTQTDTQRSDPIIKVRVEKSKPNYVPSYREIKVVSQPQTKEAVSVGTQTDTVVAHRQMEDLELVLVRRSSPDVDDKQPKYVQEPFALRVPIPSERVKQKKVVQVRSPRRQLSNQQNDVVVHENISAPQETPGVFPSKPLPPEVMVIHSNSHLESREILRLKELNAILEHIHKKQEAEVERLRTQVQHLTGLLTGSADDSRRSHQVDTMIQTQIDEFLMILNSQATELSNAHTVIKEMTKAIKATSENHWYQQHEHERKVAGMKIAYSRLWNEYERLKNAPIDPNLIIKGIPTGNAGFAPTQALTASHAPVLKPKQSEFKEQRLQRILATDSALHRPLTPETFPTEEFSVVLRMEENRARATVNRSHMVKNSPFSSGDVQAIEGFRPGKVLKALPTNPADRKTLADDPLAVFSDCYFFLVVAQPLQPEHWAIGSPLSVAGSE